jgi:hypothetical protein
MPGVALHLLVAQRSLEALRASGEGTSFDLADPVSINAFHQGAIGPDLGYFPGGYRPLSDLAHCVRTGALTRALIRRARSPTEHAFAWGWLSHVLADREIHPWIGCGVGEALTGRRDHFVDGSSRPLEHLRVEMGVDAAFAVRDADLRATTLHPIFDEDNVGFLVGAYAGTYGVAIPDHRFLASHQATGLRAGQGLAMMGVIGALMQDQSGSVMLDGVRWLLRRAYDTAPLRGNALAYMTPIRPARWLLSAISRAVARLPAAFMRLHRSGAVTLADHNLDTGRLSAAETDHLGTERALEALRGLMSGGGPEATNPGRATPPMPAGERARVPCPMNVGARP